MNITFPKWFLGFFLYGMWLQNTPMCFTKYSVWGFEGMKWHIGPNLEFQRGIFLWNQKSASHEFSCPVTLYFTWIVANFSVISIPFCVLIYCLSLINFYVDVPWGYMEIFKEQILSRIARIFSSTTNVRKLMCYEISRSSVSYDYFSL